MDQNQPEKIIVTAITKNFNIGAKKNENALTKILSLFLIQENKRPIEAIKNVSFTVLKGEKLGLIGGNGSGKSTLLRIIAGIYKSDKGKISCQGKVIYINGFGIGLKQRLTMSDNIYLLSSIMGLSRKETKKRFANIVAFSELEEFVDTKIYQFSYGMILRLCFSIAIHCLEYGEHDIMLLDEVFGSGADFNFEQKAIAKMEKLIKKGASVIIVSHNLEIIEKYCDRVILMEEGQIIKEGWPKEVISAYVNNKK